MAIGPTLGGLLIHFTGSILSVFWLAIITGIVYGVMVLFVVPESVSSDERRAAQEIYAKSSEVASSTNTSHISVSFLCRLRSLFAFLRPLQVLLPQTPPTLGPNWATRRDWSMTLLAVSYALVVCMAVRQF